MSSKSFVIHLRAYPLAKAAIAFAPTPAFTATLTPSCFPSLQNTAGCPLFIFQHYYRQSYPATTYFRDVRRKIRSVQYSKLRYLP